MPIDVCKVFGPDTIFLQQAAYLTGGCYLNLDSNTSLLQCLTVCSALPGYLTSLFPPPLTVSGTNRCVSFPLHHFGNPSSSQAREKSTFAHRVSATRTWWIWDMCVLCVCQVSAYALCLGVVCLCFIACSVFCKPVVVCATCK